ncbi:MAG TPA: hypothetical protein VFG73_02145 [Rhodanobacteraceae bacterium]|nr:hypothetical protein [Rhodanobacteraceae bacterium]
MIQALVIAILLGLAGTGVQTWRLHDAQTDLAAAHLDVVKAQRDHALAVAKDNAAAVKDWRAEWDRQQAADATRRAQDQQRDSETAAALRALGDQYAALVDVPAPAGSCTLSPDWIRTFNEAR